MPPSSSPFPLFLTKDSFVFLSSSSFFHNTHAEKKNSIVLENSGVAEPQNIRDKFNEAVANGHPLASRLHLDTMVTIVDAASFVADFASRAPLAARPDLGEGGNLRPVVDQHVEQVECADFVVLNKVDQLRKSAALGQEGGGDKGAAAVEAARGGTPGRMRRGLRRATPPSRSRLF